MSKRLTKHPRLTSEKQAELDQAAIEEDAYHYSTEGQLEFQRDKQRAVLKKLLANLTSELTMAKSELGISYSDLESRTGIDRPALSRFLSGKNENPTLETVIRIAAALEKDLVFELKE